MWLSLFSSKPPNFSIGFSVQKIINTHTYTYSCHAYENH